MECSEVLALCGDMRKIWELDQDMRLQLMLHLRRCERCKTHEEMSDEKYLSVIQTLVLDLTS